MKTIYRAIGFIAVPVAWWLLHLVVQSDALPAPGDAVRHFFAVGPARLWRHGTASLLRVLAALALSLALATPLGIAMGRLRGLDWFLAPFTYLLYPIPKITLLPVVLIVVGTGETSRVFLLFLVLFFQILVAVRDGARDIEPQRVEIVRSFGANPLQSLYLVVIPSILPRLFTSLRIAAATALAVLFFAETYVTDRGLGYFIVESWMRRAYDDMFAGIIAMSLLGFALFVLIDGLDRRFCAWARHTRKERTE